MTNKNILIQRLPQPFQENILTDQHDDAWVLSLSDLMSLLLIFFLVWTTVKIANLKKHQASSEAGVQMAFSPRPNSLEGLKDTLMEFSPVTTSDGNVVIVLEEDLSFDSASAKLSPTGKRIIKRIAQKLKTGSHYRIRVLGHSDNMPIPSNSKWEDNFELSLYRAAAVASQLISDGIPPGRVTCQGFGAMYPLQKNDDSRRHFNRRVELVIEPLKG